MAGRFFSTPQPNVHLSLKLDKRANENRKAVLIESPGVKTFTFRWLTIRLQRVLPFASHMKVFHFNPVSHYYTTIKFKAGFNYICTCAFKSGSIPAGMAER